MKANRRANLPTAEKHHKQFTYKPLNQMMAKGEDLRLKGGNVPVQRTAYRRPLNRLSVDRSSRRPVRSHRGLSCY
jgi:hypothetical protein